MTDEHERFISEDAELKHIRAKRLKELVGLGKEKQERKMEPEYVTDTNFNEIIRKNSLALIDCWAAWCGPCRALGPTIEELADDYAGRVFIGRLNVDENPQIAGQFQVYSIPTMLIMKKGKEVDRIVGLCPKNRIETILKKHMK